ncbi:hypothetical protein, partial [Candidatus Ichthyocystis hellenicum]|uniref:hypothetical protein n=1 Tax=Candidatus Ichthyocystis hellenicum TaxID=1561003 RepID=UPI00111272C9
MNIDPNTNSSSPSERSQEAVARQSHSNNQNLSESNVTPENRGRSTSTGRIRSVSLLTRSIRSRIGQATVRARAYVSRMRNHRESASGSSTEVETRV